MGQFSRRHFMLASSAFLAGPLAVHAQPAARVRRIGELSASPDPKIDAWLRDNLGAALRRAGYVEGRNIEIDWRLSLPLGASLALTVHRQHQGRARGRFYGSTNPSAARGLSD